MPISPTIEMLTMVRVLEATLTRFGQLGRRARIVITVGGDIDLDDLIGRLPWIDPDRIEFRSCPRLLYNRFGIFGTVMHRLNHRYESDVVVLADADLVIAGRLNDLVRHLRRSPEVSGVIAHATPFTDGHDLWDEIFRSTELQPPERPYEYSGWPLMDPNKNRPSIPNSPAPRTPAYFNLGLVGGPRTTIAKIGSCYEEMFIATRRALGTTVFAAQIALTLSIARLRIPHRALPMRFNFANDPRLEALHPEELRDIRVVHLLRNHQGVNKRRLYRGVDDLRAMAARYDLSGANEAARRSLSEVLVELEAAPTAIGEIGETAWW